MPTKRKYGLLILGVLTMFVILLFVAMSIPVTSRLYIIRPKSAAFGIIVLLLLILETLVGIELGKKKEEGENKQNVE